MDLATLLVYALIGLWLFAVIAAVVRVWQARSPRLMPLSPELRQRFLLSWERIASRFVEAPREAAYEADAPLVSLLVERGHPVAGDRLPGRIEDARRWLELEGKEGTEALRQAMLHYEIVFNRMIGGRARDKATEKRREMA
jgi:hypothetical protein